MNYLFIFAIGPVQDFIATARRSRDLWYGSWMLSELAKATANSVAEKYGVDHLIFPAPSDFSALLPGSEINVPNKIVVLLNEFPEKFGEQIREEMIRRLDTLWKEAKNKIGGEISWERADKQVRDLPEFYWVSVAFEKPEEYPQARDKAEALLAARKNTRNFDQSIGDNSPKSSLDGARESVIPEETYPRGNNDPERKQKINLLYRSYRARPGERLSGVDLLKRLGELDKEPDFKSTSHMAAVPFLLWVDKENGHGQADKMLEEIKDMFEASGWPIGEQDGALIYESRLTEWIPSAEDQKTLKKRLSEIIEKYAGKDRLPGPYYALLAADGDNMGKTIDAQKNPADHRRLSQNLSEFARMVPGIIENHLGLHIYSGGDDVLAYLPMNSALKCARELERAFNSRLGVFKAIDDGREITPTLSVGIVIAHHLTPLSDVLEVARDAEREAKKVPGKNALAVTLSKRSGVDRTISGKWGQIDIRMDRLIDFSRQGAISAGAAYELQELHRLLSPAGIPPTGIAAEALRIIKRKREARGEEFVSETVLEIFREWLEEEKLSPFELAQEMIIAKNFADAADLAGEPLPSEQEVS